MVTVEIRFEDSALRIRQFGCGEFKRWTSLYPGDQDERMTGWSYDELRRLGEGVWGFPETTKTDSSATFEALTLHGEPV